MGDFGAVTASRRRPLRATIPSVLGVSHIPHLLVDLEGRCVYASKALAALLQCSVQELLGGGWRQRISPFAADPFDCQKALHLAATRRPIRLHNPTTSTEIVTRIRTVSDPSDPGTVAGFFGVVQLVRVHRRTGAAVVVLGCLLASA